MWLKAYLGQLSVALAKQLALENKGNVKTLVKRAFDESGDGTFDNDELGNDNAEYRLNVLRRYEPHYNGTSSLEFSAFIGKTIECRAAAQ